MFARKTPTIATCLLTVILTACTQTKPTLPSQGIVPQPTPVASPTASASPTPSPQPKTNPDLTKSFLKNAEDEKLRRWTKEDIHRAEDQLVKIEERIKQNPDPNHTFFMRHMAQRLRQSIARAKELQNETKESAH